MTHLSQKYLFNVYKISTLKEMSVIIPPLQKYSCKHLRGVVDVAVQRRARYDQLLLAM